MPVLESTGEITPKSILRHRPIGDGDNEDSQSKRSASSPPVTPAVKRASRAQPKQTEDDAEIGEWQRAEEQDATDLRTRQVPRASTPSKTLPKTPHPKRIGTRGRLKFPSHAHPLLYLGIGMIAMLALWTLLTSAVSWWNTTMDDIHYGRPRTFQTDAFVGHNESSGTPSHFIAINLNGRIEIIEFPGGDGSKARIYIGPQLFAAGDDLVPVTLSFLDVNGDHRPDMIVHFQSSRIVFINDQGGFRPLRADEQPAVEKFLQQHGQ